MKKIILMAIIVMLFLFIGCVPEVLGFAEIYNSFTNSFFALVVSYKISDWILKDNEKEQSNE
jgi:hypothetical protein